MLSPLTILFRQNRIEKKNNQIGNVIFIEQDKYEFGYSRMHCCIGHSDDLIYCEINTKRIWTLCDIVFFFFLTDSTIERVLSVFYFLVRKIISR